MRFVKVNTRLSEVITYLVICFKYRVYRTCVYHKLLKKLYRYSNLYIIKKYSKNAIIAAREVIKTFNVRIIFVDTMVAKATTGRSLIYRIVSLSLPR